MLVVLGGCGSNAFQSISRILESAESQDSAASVAAVKMASSTDDVCQHKEQHQIFTVQQGAHIQSGTKLPKVRMLWLLDTSSPYMDRSYLANGLVSFVERVRESSNMTAHLLVNVQRIIKNSDITQAVFDSLPKFIKYFDVDINSTNSLDKTYEHLKDHPKFWPEDSPQVIKALVVLSASIVHDRVHKLRGTTGRYPGFVSFIKETRRASNFHLFGFISLGYDNYIYQTLWKPSSDGYYQLVHKLPSDIHSPVAYRYYVQELGGQLFHLFNSNNAAIDTPPLLKWSTAFQQLYELVQVEIKKIAPHLIQTQCAIASVDSVRISINTKKLDNKQYTIEVAEGLIKITAPVKQGDTIEVHYETSMRE